MIRLMQEIHYRTTGAYKMTKKLCIVFRFENGARFIDKIFDGDDMARTAIQCFNLPDLEVTPSQFKIYEKQYFAQFAKK